MSHAVVDGAELRGIAEHASHALLATGLVRATGVLGSVARGNARANSDVDLLTITRERVPPSRLLQALPEPCTRHRVSVISRDEAAWLRAVQRGSLFVLHVRLEGSIICDPDGWLSATLHRAARVPPDVSGELYRQRRRLRVLQDLARFNGRFLFVLSDLFSIGKASAIAHCVRLGQPVFVKREALQRLATLRPSMTGDVRTIAQLEPFYNRVRGLCEPLPFSHDGDELRVRRAFDAAARLARE